MKTTPSTAEADTGVRQIHATWWEALVALTAIGLYTQTVAFGWAFDDQMGIVRNPHVHSLTRLPEIFGSTVWAGSGLESYLYRPLTVLTYAFNHAVSGLHAWSYHLVNVLLYATTPLLVFRLGRAWRLPGIAAGLGALLFAVHPLHVEVVANVSGRKDLLATLFVLGMALSHRRTLGSMAGKPILPALLYACAMLSKEIGVVGIFLVAVQDALLDRDRRAFFSRPDVVGTYLVYGAVLAAYVVVHVAITGVIGVPGTSAFDNPLVEVGFLTRVATALVVVGKGVVLFVAPIGLSPDYSFDAIPVVHSVTDPRLLAGVAGLGLIAWALTRPGVRRSMLPLATAWYALALLPVSNLLITSGTIFGERLLYLPGVAACLAVGTGIAWLSAHRSQLAVGLLPLLSAAWAAQTVRYSRAWSDDISLFEWAAASVPRSTKAHHKLGEEYLRAGRVGDALRSLDRALAIAPDNRFAVATLDQARRAAIERYGRTTEGSVEDPDVLYVLGQAAMTQGDTSRAVARWDAAIAGDPTHAASLADLGAFRLQTLDTAAATAYLERAVAADPDLASAWYNLGTIGLAQHRTDEALAALRRFVRAAGSRFPDQVGWASDMLRRAELPPAR